jgi:hypothetical protein
MVLLYSNKYEEWLYGTTKESESRISFDKTSQWGDSCISDITTYERPVLK